MRARAAEFGRVLLCQVLRTDVVDKRKDVVHLVIFVLVLHQCISACSEIHLLQALALPVVGVGRLRAVAQFLVHHVSELVVAHHIYNNAFHSVFIARERRYLSGGDESKIYPCF